MLTWLSFYQFQLPLEPAIIGLIFFLVLSAYNVYWMIWMLLTDKKNKQIFTLSRYAARLVLIFLSGVAILDIVWYRPFLLQLLWWPSIFLLLYFFISFKNFHSNSSNGFFSIGCKSFVLAFTWAITTVTLPLPSLSSLLHPSIALLFVNRLFFIWMICLVFEMKEVIGRTQLQKQLFYWMLALLLLHTATAAMLPSYYFFRMSACAVLALLLFLLSWMKKRSFYLEISRESWLEKEEA